MSKLYIPVLPEPAREQRRSINAAKLVAEVGKTFDNLETETVDPKDFSFLGMAIIQGERIRNIAKLQKESRGFYSYTEV